MDTTGEKHVVEFSCTHRETIGEEDEHFEKAKEWVESGKSKLFGPCIIEGPCKECKAKKFSFKTDAERADADIRR